MILFWTFSTNYSGICLEGLKRSMKNLSRITSYLTKISEHVAPKQVIHGIA
jgi:hypothetical protein